MLQKEIQTVSTRGSGQVYSEAVKNAEEERAALAAAAKKGWDLSGSTLNLSSKGLVDADAEVLAKVHAICM